ncbi:MAG: family 65 glycosyl hydrolase domain-containing protein [Bacteroidales bacterium]|jgi:maltose phosphorylase
MNKYLKTDPWCIIEEGFDPQNNRASESIFSLGNGRFGQRANFEEQYTGDSLQGNYLAGVYYPDKTKVGWWKNGYPEYFAKVLNAPNWIGIDIEIGEESLDLAKCKVHDFKRTLNMKKGYLQREFIAELSSGKQVKATVIRFLSMANPETAAICYTLQALNFDADITVTSYTDAGIKNADANYDEYFWDVIRKETHGTKAFITSRTRKTNFDCCVGIHTCFKSDTEEKYTYPESLEEEKWVATRLKQPLARNKELTVIKYAAVLTSFYHSGQNLKKDTEKVLEEIVQKGFDTMFSDHMKEWEEKWEHSDIAIEGDDEAQQGIRFNIFQLNQTYTGEDERLNIGPKGFTGEKYGGSTYWDTEAYCIPFFLCTAPQQVSRNLLLYRYKQLDKAIENGKKLGFRNGAALFPMVTMNGEECHNEWEITFEEIHRNGAIAYAIYNYIKHTNDRDYLTDYGLEVLIAVSRFWEQRVNFSQHRNQYVILGVTGPNEYENNVNNNWYTNTIASWTLTYTIGAIGVVKQADRTRFDSITAKTNFNETEEIKNWEKIISNMYFPVHEELNIFLQQDGYLDKEQILAGELNPEERPVNQHWSWDRILRSCFIKQADVLQGVYLFEDKYDTDTIRRNFDFYESRTVHESSLSPCVHSILAARIGDIEKAYDLYLRTSRLDLDDYNNEVCEGLHITSMAGTWMSVVEGFGGKRIIDGKLALNPMIPGKWRSYSFKINFRKSLLDIYVTENEVKITNLSGKEVPLLLYGKSYNLRGESEIIRPQVNYYTNHIPQANNY